MKLMISRRILFDFQVYWFCEFFSRGVDNFTQVYAKALLRATTSFEISEVYFLTVYYIKKSIKMHKVLYYLIPTGLVKIMSGRVKEHTDIVPRL